MGFPLDFEGNLLFKGPSFRLQGFVYNKVFSLIDPKEFYQELHNSVSNSCQESQMSFIYFLLVMILRITGGSSRLKNNGLKSD